MSVKDRSWAIRNQLTGKAGEHAVASQLFLRGELVMFPQVDLGYDLRCENGCRIQVRSAHLCVTEKAIRKTGSGAYYFPLLKVKRRAVTKDRSVNRPRLPFVDVCDFVVFWGIEENRFWVVPADLCDQVSGVILGRPDPGRWVGDVKAIREMRALGYSLQKIADHYNIDRITVMNLLKSDKDYQHASFTSRIRTCEGAWENILDFRSVPTTVASEVEK